MIISVLIGTLAAAILYACAGVIATIIATVFIARLPDVADAPESHVLPLWLVPGISAVLGTLLVLGHSTIGQLGLIALLVIPLGAICIVDARKGLIPDALTLLPLVVLLAWTALHGPWIPMFLGAIIPFGAFALSAALSKGRGLGWGDAKLAAFGGAILGMSASLFAFALASLVAVAFALIRGKGMKAPIAFGPFLVIAIVIGILVQAHR